MAFDAAAVRDFATLADFNALDGGLCDPFEDGLLAFVRDVARRVLPAGDLGDFLRVFLDIRLPFVAFRGSIIEVLRQAGIGSTAGQVRSARSMLKRNSTRYPFARRMWPPASDDEHGYQVRIGSNAGTGAFVACRRTRPCRQSIPHSATAPRGNGKGYVAQGFKAAC
jgi:hypothetical protein